MSQPRSFLAHAPEILMAMYRCGPGEALELLRRASQDGNVKAHVLAATLADLARRGLIATDAEHQETWCLPLPQAEGTAPRVAAAAMLADALSVDSAVSARTGGRA